MALARARRAQRAVDYWPGFVDALSTMLLMFTFLLSVFVLGQFFLSQEVTGKDEALNRLNSQIEELSQLLALERSNSRNAVSVRQPCARISTASSAMPMSASSCCHQDNSLRR